MSSESQDAFIGRNWYVVSASGIGKSHLTTNTVCQDSYYEESLGNGWGIAVVSDGAGTASHSEVGSKHVAKKFAPDIFIQYVKDNRFIEDDKFPTEADWVKFARNAFVIIREKLVTLASEMSIETSSLACTAIVIIYSPTGLLSTHIGDGRAGYCDENNVWKSVLTPHKGEEANQTIFVTSKNWCDDEFFTLSDIIVPESRVITNKPIAFTLMSDGCENHSFICSVMDTDQNKWTDPNEPYSKFFNPLTESLKSMQACGLSKTDANQKWHDFIKHGNPGLINEPDDKTLVLGVLV